MITSLKLRRIVFSTTLMLSATQQSAEYSDRNQSTLEPQEVDMEYEKEMTAVLGIGVCDQFLQAN